VIGAEDPDVKAAKVLMAGRYLDHANNRGAHAL
jgi:hypothetical protein